MACVWVEAWHGSSRMKEDNVHVVQFAVNHELRGRSSWLAVAREKNASRPNSCSGNRAI